MTKMSRLFILMLVFAFFMVSASTAFANHNSIGDGGKNYNQKKCEKAQKYLLKSQNAKNERYAEKYYQKYLKYNKYCDDDYNKYCEKALKYLAKSQNAKKPKYAQKYYQKYLKYNKYCPTPPPPNTAPVATDGAKSVEAGSTLTLTKADLAGTDAETPDSNNLTRIIVDQPTQGTLVENADGTYTYTAPATLFCAGEVSTCTVTFTFKVKDSGNLESNVATITITITAPPPPPNTAPVATDNGKTVMVGEVVTLTSTDLVGSDAEDTAASLTRIITSDLLDSSNNVVGSVTNNGDGTFTVTAPAQQGVFTIKFKVKDSGALESNEATYTITVQDASSVDV